MIEPLRLSFDVDCPPAHAFSTWTEDPSRWWPSDHSVSGEAGLEVVFEGRVGGRIFERTAGGVEHDWGEITLWEPPRRLGYLWHIGRERAAGTDVLITFHARDDGSTRVEIEHSGWERLGDEGRRWRDANLGGWTSLWPHFVDHCREADDGRLDRAIATLLGYFRLGNRVVSTPLADHVHGPATPSIYDANHTSRIRAASSAEIDDVLADAEREFASVPHRTCKVDPRTPTAFEARLLLAGFAGEAELQLLLTGELRATPPAVDIRPVHTEADWQAVAALTRLDHLEEAQEGRRPPMDESVTEQMVATKRAKAPDLQFFLARDGGEDCAFFSSWPGVDGIGKVEDLFTHPDHRRRGVATALIVHAVHDARQRGAGPVLIGAVPNDTPRLLYDRLGFRPLCVLRSYTLAAP